MKVPGWWYLAGERSRKRSEPVIFTCNCSWVFVLNQDFVVGPFYNNADTMSLEPIRSGRVMTPEQFADNYADCAWAFRQHVTDKRFGTVRN